MNNYANVKTGAIASDLPKQVALPSGITFNPTLDQLSELGWRKVVSVAAPLDGHRVLTYAVVELDKYTCRLAVDSSIDLVAAEAARLADKKAAEDAAALVAGDISRWRPRERLLLRLIYLIQKEKVPELTASAFAKWAREQWELLQ